MLVFLTGQDEIDSAERLLKVRGGGGGQAGRRAGAEARWLMSDCNKGTRPAQTREF